MKTDKIIFFFCALLLLSIGCRKDTTEELEIQTESAEPLIFLRTSYSGLVFDSQGKPLQDVTVKMQNNYATTDSRGFYRVEGSAPAEGVLVSASMAGYYDAYAHVIPTADGIGHLRFTLLPRVVTKVVSSNANTTVLLDNGSEVSFLANSFIDESGNQYNGEVSVFANYIDPSASDFGSIMPGDLAGTTLDDRGIVLQSFGILNVELESENGAKLQINKKATIKVKVPNSKLGEAPESVLLWYLDTESGKRKEEGKATLMDNYYIGEVKHFTLWDCAVPFPRVVLTGNVTSRDLIPFTKVKITWINTGEMRFAYTDSEGDFGGMVPFDELILLEIIDACGNSIYSQELGPLYENTHINIFLPYEQYDFFSVEGTLLCDGETVTNGYAIIQLESTNELHLVFADQDGHFVTNLLNCDSDNLKIYGVDSDNNMQGNVLEFPIGDQVFIEELSTCEVDIGYEAIITYNGAQHIISNPIIHSIHDDNKVFLINCLDTVDGYASKVQYSFIKSDDHDGNWILGIGFSAYDNDHIVIHAKLPAELAGKPGSIIFEETDEYVQFYVPIVKVSEYSPFSPNAVAYEGSFLLRAQK